ncbi:hypothetical protein [Carnobacterium viridans]|uniref:Uncharacterized protein n=1 Tax=Carnobacterium viridans TaxID=174587 RepID=A0A1H0XI67_9LACT|nr:hypothetical protein [Carnobacterium viridans]SDQ02577.1 hypothetical protein SAMN04487752_0088 [Carnobacterium viridans]
MSGRLALALRILEGNKVLFYLPEEKKEVEVLVKEYIFTDLKAIIDNEEDYYLLLETETDEIIEHGELI